MVKHEIKLTPKKRQKLLAMVGKGRNQAVVIRRAHILLKSDEGKTDREICDQLYSTRAETAFFRFALTPAPLPHAGEGLGVRVRKVSYTWMAKANVHW